MSIFGKQYAAYYDLFYKDKDYAAEADYIDRRIRAHAPSARSVLELGCGTGRHAQLLAKKGYLVDGVEQSKEMLALAHQPQQPAGLQFFQGDIRTFQRDRTYDAVIAMFHVMSYMASNADLIRTMENASRHLREGMQ